MYTILCVVGLVGAALFGGYGLIHGGAGQLEQIWAIVCLALAGAGFVGFAVDGRRARMRERSEATTRPAHAS